MYDNDYVKCPSCGGEVLSTLKKCIYCQTILDTELDQDLSSLKYETISLYGGTYAGELLDGKPYGQGILSLPNGTKYSGEWREGKPSGQGKITYSNGGSYEGEIKNGKRNGMGLYVASDGKKLEGEWKNGSFRRPLEQVVKSENDITQAKMPFLKNAEWIFLLIERFKNGKPIWKRLWLWAFVSLFAIIIIISIVIKNSEFKPKYTYIAVGNNPHPTDLVGVKNIKPRESSTIPEVDLATFGKRWNEYFPNSDYLTIDKWKVTYYEDYISCSYGNPIPVVGFEVIAIVNYKTNMLESASTYFSIPTKDLDTEGYYAIILSPCASLIYATDINIKSIGEAFKIADKLLTKGFVDYDGGDTLVFREIIGDFKYSVYIYMGAGGYLSCNIFVYPID